MITKFNIMGMSCASCASHIEEYVKKQKGIINVSVNLIKNNMIVEYDEKVINYQDIIRFVKLSGYSANINNPTTFNNSNKKNLIKLITSGILLIILMDISMGHMIKLPLASLIYQNIYLYPILQLMILIPIIVIYFNIYISGFSKIFRLHPNMDSLISLGSVSCIIYGIYGLIKIISGDLSYLNNLYFESAGMILVLVNLGKYLESLSKQKSLRACENLMNNYPNIVNIKVNDNIVNIDINDIKIGDILVVKLGEMVACDGIVIQGEGLINTASITGESKEVFVSQNNNILSGSYVTEGYLEIKVCELPNNSTFMKIVNLVDECSSSKTKVAKLCDKIALYFVPGVVFISIITFIINYLIHKDFNTAWNFGISVLVISCPCTLGLATPVAVVVSTSKAWGEMGILIKNAQVLENLKNVDTFVFDKTGTLTTSKFIVKELKVFDNTYNVLDIIYSLEKKNPHSISNSICDYAKKRYASILDVTSYEYLIGQGVKGIIDNNNCYIGNIKYLENNNININNNILELINNISSIGNIPLIIVINNVVVGIIILQDEIKKEAWGLINELNKNHLNTIMLTGDNKNTSLTVKNNLNINEVYSEVLPNDKVDVINKLKQNKKFVAMVGDGVNDAPSLLLSDVGITISSAADVSLDVADVVLLNDNLGDIYNLYRLSKKTYKIIKGNLFWALFYNVIGIIIATGLFSKFNITLNPMIASMCMSASSIFVVLNALRINKFKKINITYLNTTKQIIKVDGMMCNHCEERINASCLKTTNVLSSKANYRTGIVEIEYEHNLNLEELENNISQNGYKLIK